MHIFEKLNKLGLCHCLICGSYFPEESQCCVICQEKIEKYFDRSASQSLVNGVKALSLFKWDPKASDSLSTYILSLKDGQNHRAWNWVAKQFLLQKNSKLSFNSKQIVLIPAAPKKTNQKDHAYFFARSLAGLGVGEIILAFEPRESNSRMKQRKLSKNARQNSLKKELNVNISSETLSNKQVIFVDDVVTTGSTALQAYESLKKPESFAVWTLASRGLSCE